MTEDLLSLDFAPFHIFSANGQQYCGVKPSEIPKPFISVAVILNKRTYRPGMPKGYTRKHVIGYDAAIRVGMNMTETGGKLSTDKVYRMITLLDDGKKWSKLICLNGDTEEGWI